ncbi:creatininase family protein [Jiella sp. M17.18]|uniref:creatininase family protein n=1 Tax=Jiella sp. M17.18 TaxID=3234247 RepID=UPI0034DE3CA7
MRPAVRVCSVRTLRPAAVALFLLLTATTASSASVFLEDQTWTELRDAIASGKTTIIIPIGGTEQSGPAIALGKHNVRVKILAQKIAETLGDAFVAPVVSYVPEGNVDPPTGHMKFPGTITIGKRTFEDLLESAARSFRHAGFRTIVLIGDHGGYQADETAVADRLNREWAKTPTRAYPARIYYSDTQHAYGKALLAAGVKPSEIGTHAGLADTSLMLATDPSMVRMDAIARSKGFSAKDGVYGGDPRRSSARLGQIGVDLVVRDTVAAIRQFTAGQGRGK